uniref:LITAF domain-containing protein n=1 Tax=Cyclopterus lumpus TaxID=8103 RepID=A0A8C2WPC9_CYCLU
KMSHRCGRMLVNVLSLCVSDLCVAGCCLIPFCMSRLNNVHHQCPECRAIVHTYRPL